eukprot:7506061-Alexandrium_andersonii.AAC.1
MRPRRPPRVPSPAPRAERRSCALPPSAVGGCCAATAPPGDVQAPLCGGGVVCRWATPSARSTPLVAR